MCRWFLGHHSPGDGARRHRATLNVMIDVENLPDGIGSLVGGATLDSTTVRRLLSTTVPKNSWPGITGRGTSSRR